MKLLVVKLSSLGDVVHAFALVNRLKQARPEVTVDWLVNDAYSPLVKCNDNVNRIWQFKRESWGKKWGSPTTISEIFSLVSWIRKERYEVCLDLQGLFRSGALTFFSGADKRVGFANAREGARFLYGNRIPPGDKPHAADILLNTLGFFGVSPPPSPDFSFRIPPPSGEAVRKLLSGMGIGERYVVFHPGARWRTKMWPLDSWRILARDVSRKSGLPIVFTGSAKDCAMINGIIGDSPGLFNLAGGLGLVETSALLKNCSFMVTVDSGPMHIAAAFNRPIVALFGPTSPERTGPLTGGPSDIARASGLSCAPCFSRDCGRKGECLEAITPDDIEFRVMRMISFLKL